MSLALALVTGAAAVAWWGPAALRWCFRHVADPVAMLLGWLGLLVAMIAGAVAALLAGRWADKAGKPVVPLTLSCGGAAIGLVIMALATGGELAVAGYILFGLSTSVFLALHSAHTLRVLPDSTRRGRDLGLFNLTNTIPSLAVPALTLALVPSLGFAALFAVLAALAVTAMVLLSRLQH